jgi:CRISPR/Cas system-associated exonuclease Cas4 (RecB family)
LSGREKLIRASEVGEYVYCARAWWLRRGGVEPSRGREARAAGTAWHAEHGRGVTAAARLRRLSAAAGLLALVCALALIILRLWPR